VQRRKYQRLESRATEKTTPAIGPFGDRDGA